MVQFTSPLTILILATFSWNASYAFVPSITLTSSPAKSTVAKPTTNTWGVVITTSGDIINKPNHYRPSSSLFASETASDDYLAKLVGRRRFKAIKRKVGDGDFRYVSKMSTVPAPDTLKIIIAGAPASGKGTQCEKIKETFGLVHLSTGDMLRAAVAAKSGVGQAAKSYMDSGKLVPDDVIIGVVKDRLKQPDCKNKGWLLDGFPRTQAQADALATSGVSADCFLFLNVPDEDIVQRVVGRRTDPATGKIYHLTFSPPPADDEELQKRLVQRSDDTEEKITVRLEQFRNNVAAVKGCYTDISVDIDGTGKPDQVAEAISKALKEKCGDKAKV